MNFTVVIGLQEEKPALYPDVSDGELHALGKVTASWAILEYLIIKITIALAECHNYTLPTGFLASNSLDKTLREFKTQIKLIQNPEGKRFLENILKRTQNLKTQRHLLTHGISMWDVKNPDKIKISSLKKKQQPQHFDAQKINKIAQQIGELNFKIMYPDGINQFYEDKVKTGCSMSRMYAISATETISNDPTLNIFSVKKKSTLPPSRVPK